MPTPTATNRPMTPLEWAMLVTLSAVWGGSYFFNAIAVAELPVFTVVAARVAPAALILLAVLRLSGRRMPRDPRAWTAFLGMGLLNNAIPFSLIVWSQQHVASGVASILNAATPLFTVILAHAATQDQKMTGGRLFGVVAGLAGVAVMVGLSALRTPGTGVTAQLVCLAGALSFAIAGLFGQRFQALGVAPTAAAAGQLLASSTLLIPIALLSDQPWTLPAPSARALAALAGLALLSTAFGYVLYFRILATAGATNLLLVTFLIPVSALLLGTLFLHETLLPRHLAGIGLIGLGLAAIDGRPWRMLRGTG